MSALAVQITPELESALCWGGDALDALDAWTRYQDDLLLGRYRRRHRTATAAAYQFPLLDFWAHVTPTPWEQITPEQYQAYLDRPTHGPAGGLLAANSRALYSTAILGFYRWATWAGLLEHNPLEGIRPDPKVEPPARGLDLEQVGELLAATATQPRTHLAIALGFWALLRAGEIARLRIEDVDLRAGELLVYGKGGLVDSVPIHDDLRPILLRSLEGRPATGPVIEHARQPGRHVSSRTVSRMIGRAMGGLGWSEHAHVLRHSAAYLLLEETGDIDAVSRLLRHRQLSSTQRYVRKADRKLAARLNQLPDPRMPQ
jgi:integrase